MHAHSIISASVRRSSGSFTPSSDAPKVAMLRS
jgi:hypothetical protein